MTGSGRAVEVPGGPAWYIGNALSDLDYPYRVLTGELAKVDVISDGDAQEYVIPSLPAIPLPPLLEGDAVILSPIQLEVDPLGVPPVEGMLVVDVQGFVRTPGVRSGQCSGLRDLSSLIARSSIVKVAASETACLDSASIAALDRTMTLITRGRSGAVLRYGGREFEIAAQPVPAPDTVGAGDTFLAAFVVALLRDAPPRDAATEAARFTEAFLLRKGQISSASSNTGM